jgi:hypothetical protein
VGGVVRVGRTRSDTEYFKWGWSEADGEAVWPVGGPGDGWPGHAEHLEVAWGGSDTSAMCSVLRSTFQREEPILLL